MTIMRVRPRSALIRLPLLFTLLLISFACTTPDKAGKAPEEIVLKPEPQLNLTNRGQNAKWAIAYSPFRHGQAPGKKEPSAAEIKDDLKILEKHWGLIRLYGSGPVSKTILDVIRKEKIKINVMLGMWLTAEVNNPRNTWASPQTDAQLAANKQLNAEEVERGLKLAKDYPDIVSAISVGNEALVDWTDHLIPEASVIAYVKKVKAASKLPITVAENYVPWRQGLDALAQELDFLTIHTYPIWEKKSIDEAMAYTIQNIRDVKAKHPNKPLVIGEAGWTTGTNAKEIPSSSASETQQKRYFQDIHAWAAKQNMVLFFFEAFDEDWKGSSDATEPEKHWGVFYIDRTPKPVMQDYFPELKKTES